MPTLSRKSATRTLVAGLALASVAGCAAPEPRHPEITAVLDTQAAAWNRGDIDGFMEGYWRSDDLTFISRGKQADPAGGPSKETTTTTRGWQATLERYKAKYPTRELMGTLTFGDLVVGRSGDDTANVAGRYHLERGDNDATGRFYLDMRRINGRWVIVKDRTTAD